MPLHPAWSDLAVRLALTVVASALIGLDRGVSGHSAGVRTTILVGLAAAAAMIQANILLQVGGRTPAAFSTMDVMRLPLGILTGVGFIGGGAILKRGELILGVTTAATLWAATVIGLCFGGGQIDLGLVTTAIALATLTILKWFDVRIPRERRATLIIRAEAGTARSALPDLLTPLGYNPHFRGQTEDETPGAVRLDYDVRWRRADAGVPPFDLIERVEARYRIVSLEIISTSHE